MFLFSELTKSIDYIRRLTSGPTIDYVTGSSNCQCRERDHLQGNAPVHLHELGQIRVVVERPHPDPRVADAHQLIPVIDSEARALLGFDAILAAETALGLRVSNQDAKACRHQLVHLSYNLS